jgi:predicted PurR-regulated permease PerM
VPHFVGRTTGLHPVAGLLAIVICVKLAGIIGAVVTVPVLAGLWKVFRVLSLEPEAPS